MSVIYIGDDLRGAAVAPGYRDMVRRQIGHGGYSHAAWDASVRAENARRLDSLVSAERARNPEFGARFDSLLADVRSAHARRDSSRRDAFSATGGMAGARQLEYIYADVLREEVTDLSAFSGDFYIDESVPPGARTHTVRRIYGSGEAAVHAGGAAVPRVGISQEEEEFRVVHLVTSFAMSLWEMMSSAFANTAEAAEKLRVARQIVMEMANQKLIVGDDSNKIYGVLNYPYVDQSIRSVAYDGTASGSDVLADLNDLFAHPSNSSRGKGNPNTIAFSPRVHNYLATTPHTSGNDTMILEIFLRTHPGVRAVRMPELEAAGPDGTSDGVLVYRNDRMALALVVPQPFATLPVQSAGFDDMTFCHATIGGAVMRNAYHNVIGWVDAG